MPASDNGMIKLAKKDIVRDVRIAIDENMIDDVLLEEEDVDTLSLDEIILSKICDGVRAVEMRAPLHMLHTGHNFNNFSIVWNSDGHTGHVLLPSDFMRLIAFRMSDWERTVFEAQRWDDPRYTKNLSRHRGVGGTPQRPVCAIIPRAEGRSLEFYSCNSTTAQVVQAVYLPQPSIDSTGGIDVSRLCYQAEVYAIAALVLHSYGEHDKAAQMEALSNGLIEQ